MYIHTYLQRPDFPGCPLNSPLSTAGEGKPVPGAASIPRLGWGPHQGDKTRRATRRITSDSQKPAVEQMHRLRNHSKTLGSHLHPIPRQHFCATLSAASPSTSPATASPPDTAQATPGRNRGLNSSRLGGQKWCFSPQKRCSGESLWLQGCLLNHQPCPSRLHGQPVLLNRYTPLP